MYPSSVCLTWGRIAIPQFSLSPTPPSFSPPRSIRSLYDILCASLATVHNLKSGEIKTEDDVHFAIIGSPGLKTVPTGGDNQTTSSNLATRETRQKTMTALRQTCRISILHARELTRELKLWPALEWWGVWKRYESSKTFHYRPPITLRQSREEWSIICRSRSQFPYDILQRMSPSAMVVVRNIPIELYIFPLRQHSHKWIQRKTHFFLFLKVSSIWMTCSCSWISNSPPGRFKTKYFALASAFLNSLV